MALAEEIGQRIQKHGGAAIIIDYGSEHISFSIVFTTL
jgi:SAM-dependent MidA family methyltransferase